MSALPPFVCPKCGGEPPFIHSCAVCGGTGLVWPPYPSEWEEDGAVRVSPAKRCPRCLMLIGAFPHMCWRRW